MSEQLVYTRPMVKGGKPEERRAAETASPGPMMEYIEHRLDGSHSAFADQIDESRQTITNWKKRGIPLNAVERVARAMGYTYDQYMALTRGERVSAKSPHASDSGYVMIPAYDSMVGLGPGRFNEDHVEIIGYFPYSAKWIRDNGWRPEDLGITIGEGDSMQPAIFHGDRLLVHFAENNPKKIVSHEIYAIEDADSGTRVKRLIRTLDKRILVHSDNNASGKYPDEYLTPDTGARIIGRVVDRSGPPR